MNINQFFDAVWPSAGPYLVAIPSQFWSEQDQKTIHYFKHFPHADKASAAQHAMALAHDRDAPKDVYFALGSVLDTSKKKIRTQPNISALRAFWLDIDVKQEPGAYTTVDAAASNLKAFCKQLALPKPLVVSSGGGLHVYWPMDADVPADQWKHYATLLKGLTKEWGLRVDQSRTADQASVLRPVDTQNWKTGNPRPVQVVSSLSGPIPKTTMMARIAAAADSLSVSVPSQVAQTSDLGIAGTNPAAGAQPVADNSAAANGAMADEIPSNPKRVVAKCQQLKWQVIHAEQVDEPQWYAMIGCLRHADRGEEAVHRMSRQYSGYTQAETDAKIAHHKEGGYGPSTCIAFENARPGGCDGCPYAGRVTTPLQLGREKPESAAPTVAFEQGGQQVQMQLPDPPAPFKRRTEPSTGRTYIVVTRITEDDEEEEIVIHDNDVYPCGLVYNERDSSYYVQIRRYLPRDGWAEFDVQTGKFYDKKALAITLGNIGVMPDIDKVETLVQYMIAYIKQLQNAAKAQMVYAKMGWREDDTFVLPNEVLTKDGSEGVTPSKNIANSLEWRAPKGDINEWIKIAKLFEKPGMESHQFAFGVGLAAPLFKYTNYNGMIVSLVGEKGSGKSSAVMLANSVWGHRTFGWADSEHDTLNAFYNKLGVCNNLPVTFDEITNLDPDRLSDLCYAVSKGQGRQRLERDGSAKENFGSWQTMMLTSSNRSLQTKLSQVKADASAEAVRVFEYWVPSHTLPKHQADAAFDKLNDHYGLAGPVFMREVLKDPGQVRDRVKHWMKVVEQQAQVTSGERFWSAAPACVLAAFEVTNRLGLTNADLGRLIQFAVDTIETMRNAVAVSTRSGMGVLTDYLNSSINKTLTISQPPQQGMVAMVAQEPRAGELRIRIEKWHNLLYLDRADFRRFCAERSVDPTRLRDEMERHGVLKEEKRASLGKDTNFGAGQTWCWVLDLNNPAMGGAQAQASAQNATAIASQAVATAQGQTQ